MHRGLAAALVLVLALPALAGCLSAAPSSPQSAPLPGSGKAPLTTATHKLGKFISTTVASKDGTPLHVDVQLPDGEGKFPVMLTLTPYALLGEDASGLQADEGLPFGDGYAPEYVAYGYAVAVAHVRGTGESGGCLTIGDPVEGQDGYALVEWLANQTWSNGKVAMIGTSYDGTTPLETAVWQPPHLATIVPISAVTEWYRYYFELGAHRRNGDPFPGSSDTDPLLWGVIGAQPPVRGGTPGGAQDAQCSAQYAQEDDAQDDYDAYWHARDHHAKAQNITVPVLYAQGWEDGNVATTGFPLLWANLTSSPEKRIWLEQHGHGVPGTKKAYHEYVHRWLDYWLLGRDNGALALPLVIIEDNMGKFRAEPDWPPIDAAPQRLFLAPGGKLANATPQAGTVSWADAGTGQEDAKTEGVDHVTFATPALAAPMHVAGTPTIHLKANGNLPGGQIDIKLYDQAPDGTRTTVSRGFLDARHRDSLDHGADLVAGTDYVFAFDLHPIDWRLAAGHALVLVVKSTDDYVVRSPYRTMWTMSLGPGASWLDVPLVPEDARHYADAAPAPWA
ncbi:MAG: uncharacterized protein QOE90_2999 [Thermoplasmata archaeon]|nr:uncharacterized protein [Thermoplasmata archaeon]